MYDVFTNELTTTCMLNYHSAIVTESSLRETACEGLAQGPYVATIAGFAPATLRISHQAFQTHEGLSDTLLDALLKQKNLCAL